MADYPNATKYGFHTPQGDDYISQGDDEISFNADRTGFWLDYVQERAVNLLPELTVSIDETASPGYLGMASFSADTDPAAPFGFKGRCMAVTFFDGFTYAQMVFERDRARLAHRTFNPASGTWREWNESNTPGALGTLQEKLSKASTQPVDLVMLGDSNIEGMGATALDDRWITRAQEFANRAAAAMPGANYPFIPAGYNHSVPGQPVTKSGNVSIGSLNFGFGWRAAQISDDTGVVTFTFKGTSAKLMLVSGASAGVSKVTVNSNPPYTIDSYSTAGTAPKVHEVQGIISGVNTVSIQRDSSTAAGRSVFLEGLLTFDSDELHGVRTIDAGFSGRKAADVTATRASNFANDVALLPNCGGVIINLLTNDVTALTPLATYKANLVGVITALRAKGYSGPVVFVTPTKGAAQAHEKISEYVKVLAEIAAENKGVAMIDTGATLPEITSSRESISELGYYADSLHFSSAGHKAMADLVIKAISSYSN